jgi:hypothetical protein
MASELNHLQADVHTAELRSRAEQYRVAAMARASGRAARPLTRRGAYLSSLPDAIRAPFAHLGTVARRTPGLGSKTRRV